MSPEELYQRYYKSVVSFFIKKGFSAEEGRDLAQETFLRVFHKFDSYRGESRIETWLFQIAANTYRMAVRSRAAQKRDAQEVTLDAIADMGQRDADPLRAILTEERARILRSAVESLPPQMRQAVFLRVGGDLKYREIADVLQVSIETVKAHLYQARQLIREELADYFTDSEF